MKPLGRTRTARVGIGGWSFDPWRETFYQADCPRDAFVFFIDAAKERAPAAAMALQQRVDAAVR